MLTFRNPITSDGLRADPFILRYDGRYYLYCTNPQILCWSSKNLIDWQLEGPVIGENEFGSLVPFAPEVIFINGIFYLYTSPSGTGHKVLQSSKPTGPFRQIPSKLPKSLDGSPFLDDDGTLFFFWADDRGILGCKMHSPVEAGETVLVCATDIGWTEGPQVIKEGGFYYLTFCANHYLSTGYRIYGAAADYPLGPFTMQHDNPLLINTEDGYVGLGHCSTIWGPDLLVRYIAYHNLNEDRSRDLNLAPLLLENGTIKILGPTNNDQEIPKQAVFSCDSYASQWEKSKGYSINPDSIIVSDKEYDLSSSVVEFSLCCGTYPYGVFLGRLRVEFLSQEKLTVYSEREIISQCHLPFVLDPTVFHTIVVISEQSKISVSLDGMSLISINGVELHKGNIGYFWTDIPCLIGHTQLSQGSRFCAFDELFVPLPARVAAKDRTKVSTSISSEFLLHVVSPEFEANTINSVVNGQRKILNKDYRGYNLQLASGFNTLSFIDLPLSKTDHLVIHPKAKHKKDHLSMKPQGSYGKFTTGDIYISSFEICSIFRRNQMGPGGSFGLIFRATNCSEGGEGNDPVLGINFFIGYSFLITADQLLLSKHCYDQKILTKVDSDLCLADSISIRVIGYGPDIKVFINDETEPTVSYYDPYPFLYGRGGFRFASCLLDSVEMTVACLD